MRRRTRTWRRRRPRLVRASAFSSSRSASSRSTARSSPLAVREALGPDVSICADANCGFSYDAARRYLAATREVDLLFLEQPFADGDLKSLAARAPLAMEDGLVTLPGKAGLGVEIDEAAVARLRVNGS